MFETQDKATSSNSGNTRSGTVSETPTMSSQFDRDAPSTTQLRVPSHQQRRRTSLDSTFTELSELSMFSNEQANFPSTRRRSTASDTSDYSVHSTPSHFNHHHRKSLRQKLADFYDQNYGALLVLLSQFFGTLMNIFTRLLEHEGPHGAPMHPFQILFARQSLTVLLCTIYALTTRSIPYFPLGPPDRQVRFLLICRGVTGFFGVFGIYFSLLYLPLSEATVLTFLAPILACYLCTYVIPGETFSRQQQLAGFVSLVGVVFIAQPLSLFTSSHVDVLSSTSTGVEAGLSVPSSIANATVPSSSEHKSSFVIGPPTPSQHLLAIATAMVGVCGATGAITSIRAIGTRAHAFISVNYFSVWSSIVSLVALLVIPSVSFRLPNNLIEWGLLFSLGTTGFVMQGLLTMGLAYEATGKGGGSGQPKVEDHLPTTESVAHHNKNDGVTEDIEMSQQTTITVDAASSLSTAGRHDEVNGRSFRKRQGQPIKAKKSSSSGTRATSMIYTQMLFALAGDRVVFGITPGVWSWLGSGLILTGAIWVASARDKPSATGKGRSGTNEIPHQAGSSSDSGKEPEENVGLLNDVDDEPTTDGSGSSQH